MTPKAMTELRAFHAFLSEMLKNGSADLLPEEALDEWRQLHPEPEDYEDDVAAINTALDELDRGEYMSLEEFDLQIQKKYNLPPPPKRKK